MSRHIARRNLHFISNINHRPGISWLDGSLMLNGEAIHCCKSCGRGPIPKEKTHCNRPNCEKAKVEQDTNRFIAAMIKLDEQKEETSS